MSLRALCGKHKTKTMSDSELETIRERWTRRLVGLRRRLRCNQAAEAIAVLLAGVVVATVLTGLIDYRFELSTRVRRFVLFIGFGVLVWSAWRRLIVPLLTKLDLLDVAALIDRATGSTPLRTPTGQASETVDHRTGQGNVVASVARVLEGNAGDSPLVRRAIANGDKHLASVPINEAVSGRHLVKNVGSSIAVLIVPIAILLAAPSVSRVWAARWIGGDDVAYPRSTSIEVVGLDNGVLRVPRGEPARVSVRVTDKSQPTQVVWMRLQPSGSDRITSTLDAYGTSEGATAVSAVPSDGVEASGIETPSTDATTSVGDFRGDLPPLGDTTPASVWGGDARPVRFSIEPVDRPQVIALDLAAKHPQEDAARTFDLTSETDVRLLKDTEATLTVRSTVPVEPVFETNAAIDIARVDDQTFEISWVHSEPTAIRIALTSIESRLESFPRTAPIGLLPDRAPSVTLRHSGVRLRVSKMATIPLSVTARDDFGIASVTLNGEAVRLQLEGEVASGEERGSSDPSDTGELNEAETKNKEQAASDDVDSDTTSESESPTADTGDNAKPKPLPKGTGDITLYAAAGSSELRIDREHRLELTSLQLKPGDVVKVTAIALDKAYGGANERKSRTITFRVVKEDDLFREILLRLQQLRSRLRKATDAADELRTDLMTAELPKAASSMARRHQVGRREVGAVATQIKSSVIEMQLNNLGGEDAEEMNELIDRTVVRPLDRLLAGAMDRQRGTLGELAKSRGVQLETDRQEAVTRQQEIVDSLNEVLKNMNQWDSFVDVVNQLNAVIGLEKKVRTKTDELRTGESGAVLDPIGNAPAGKENTKDAADDIFD